MRLRLVFGVVGRLVGPFAIAFLPPLLLALFVGDWAEAGVFAIAGVATLALGYALARAGTTHPVLRRAEALGVVTMTWLLVAACAAIPYLANSMAPEDALFEAVSGLTTTGATVLTNWDRSNAFFLWRAMTQWFGGLGVIALFVVVLPRLGIAGRQIFFFEASTAPAEAVSPSVRESARKLWVFYVGLTGLMIALLMLVGAGLYDAVIHTLTTMSAGGFSDCPTSIVIDGTPGYDFATPATHWVMIPFMFLSGASYPLFFAAYVQRRPTITLRDPEFRLYGAVTLIATAIIALTLMHDGAALEPALRDSAFQVTSLISSGGFASVDYELYWGPLVKGTLIVVMILGGCAGSAAGGAKQVRFLFVFKYLGRELTRTLHPRAVLPLRYRGQSIPNPVLRAVITLVFLYLLGYGLITLLLLLTGVPTTPGLSAEAATNEELLTAGSAAIACLSNVGPAFGPAGPMGGYADFSVVAKLLLTLAMLIGRLEIVTVLALLHPDVWRRMSFEAPRVRVAHDEGWVRLRHDDRDSEATLAPTASAPLTERAERPTDTPPTRTPTTGTPTTDAPGTPTEGDPPDAPPQAPESR